ncbi:MAG TPA: hypothetical protein VFB20_02825 [Burkholderiales bacterium]|nr:hypothetical protein [Burkholderiales bacterium]
MEGEHIVAVATAQLPHGDAELIDGDPAADPPLLRAPARMRAIMKGGHFRKAPDPAGRRP